MMKLTVAAAAFAAGMMVFAAQAQDKSIQNPRNLVETTAKKAAAGKKRKAAEAAPACPYLFGCGTAKATTKKAVAQKAQPRVDKIQTGAVSARVRPELIAKARKEIKGSPAVASGKANVSGRQYGAIVSRYAATYGISASLAHAVIRVESNYRASARGSAGEIGLMQIKPSTARMLGYSGSAKGLYNPETNIKFGMKYLAMAHKLGGGSTCGTILKYNAGHGAKRMNPVSAAYCSKVKRHLAGA